MIVFIFLSITTMIDIKQNYTLEDFNLHIFQTYRNLYADKKYTDVILVSDDQTHFPTHRFILASASKVFARILDNLSQSTPVIFLKGVDSANLESLLKFMYHGEVNVLQGDVQSFLNIMEDFHTIRHVDSKTSLSEELNSDSRNKTEYVTDGDSRVDTSNETLKEERLKETLAINLVSGDDGVETSSNTPNEEQPREIPAIKSEPGPRKNTEVSTDFRKREKKKVNYKCSFCDHVTDRKKSFQNHVEVVHMNIRGSWPCDECGTVFTSKASVRTHKKHVHEGIKYKCDYDGCDYQAKSIQNVAHHKEIHENNYLFCDQCEYNTLHNYNLKQHIKVNHSNHVYQCPHCDYKCKKSGKIPYHIRLKHEGKRLPCDQCEYMATRLDNLKSHIQSKHIKTKFECDKCDFSTVVERNFRSHKKKAHITVESES